MSTLSRLARHGRLLAALGAAQFAASVVLLLAASASAHGVEDLPRWGGPLDVVLAFSLVVTLALVDAAARGRVGARALAVGRYAAALVVPLALVAMWLFRERLDFNVLLPGLAWRSYVLLYGLPAAVAVCERAAPTQTP